MRNHLTLLGLLGVQCLLSGSCAPTDGDHDVTSLNETDAEVDPSEGEEEDDTGASTDAGAAQGTDASTMDAEAPRPAAPDAGGEATDAGGERPDAAAPKPGAGTPDAGTPKADAGPPDVGSPKSDAGTPDAGPPKPDAGTPKPDAGTPKPDAGTPKPDAGTPDAGPQKPLAATFTQVYAIIGNHCAFCHVADHIGFVLGHLDMSTQTAAYKNLVKQVAAGIDCGGTGHVRVIPGDPDKSLIILKLTGKTDCGVRMPDNYPPLSEAQIEVFRSWIRAGAKND